MHSRLITSKQNSIHGLSLLIIVLAYVDVHRMFQSDGNHSSSFIKFQYQITARKSVDIKQVYVRQIFHNTHFDIFYKF